MPAYETLRLVMDALRGREALRVTPLQLREFYAKDYVALNPELDAADAPKKAEALLGVVSRAGLSSAGRVLEVGCGSAAVLRRVAEMLRCRVAAGIDYGLGQARIARARSAVPVVVGQGEALPFRSGEFDLAYVVDVLEHVLDPVALLRELGRVGRHVGFFVPLEAGLVSSPLYAYRRARGKPTNREKYGHIWRWFRPEVHAIVRSAGLTLLATATCPPVGDPRYSTVAGRTVEALRSATLRMSPLVSEVAFGGQALVGVATSARSRALGGSPPPARGRSTGEPAVDQERSPAACGVRGRSRR